MTNIQIRCIADTRCTLGEGPVWDETRGCLWWVDILENRIYQYNSNTKKIEWWETPEHVGFIVLKKEGGFVAGLKSGLHHVELRKKHQVTVTRIDRVDEHKECIRFNDGMLDRFGRIWGCTMDMKQKEPFGKYYCYDREWNRTVKDEGYIVANGPAVSPDGLTVYTVETVGGPGRKKGIFSLSMGKREELIAWSNYSSFPDGIICDATGNLWIGEFGGNKLRYFSSTGNLLHEIEMPAWNVTKPAFSGCDRKTLFVTTARHAAGEQILEQYPLTGGVFEIYGLNIQGQPTLYR